MQSKPEDLKSDSEANAITIDRVHRNIRMAMIDDLHALVALEEACFTVPWSRKSFEAELEGNQFSRVLMVAHPDPVHSAEAIAYICVWIVFEEIRFLNLAIHPDFRRQGMAMQLIREALRLGREANCCRGMLEVRATNMPAQTLYKSFCFQAYATRKSYYTNPTEDAILMTLEPLIPETRRKEA